MKILYIVTTPEGETVKQETIDSIELNRIKGIDDIGTVTYTNLEESLNKEFERISDMDYTHVCIVSNRSTLRPNAQETMKEYVDNTSTVYLPIVELNNEEEGGEPFFRGFLNTSLWKQYFTTSIGELDESLAKKGVDLIMEGAYLPLEVIKKYKFKPEIKYFSHFEFLTRVVFNEVEVLGVPKVTVKCIKDYELKNVSKEEKLEFFKLATEDYKNA